MDNYLKLTSQELTGAPLKTQTKSWSDAKKLI